MIFISPTKNMKPKCLDLPMSLPEFCVEAEGLLDVLLTYNDEDIMQIMNVNAKLAVENQKRFQQILFDDQGVHALASYDGLVFKYMDVDSWSKEDILYANDHLRILSGFYGVVRPLDSIYPYRLEMQAKGLSERVDTLYSYWSDSLMRSMREANHDKIYINLASKEYSQAILPYLRDDETCINIYFLVIKDGVGKNVATAAKMARGQMVTYIMKHRIDTPEQVKKFDTDGWTYDCEKSNESDYVFVKHQMS